MTDSLSLLVYRKKNVSLKFKSDENMYIFLVERKEVEVNTITHTFPNLQSGPFPRVCLCRESVCVSVQAVCPSPPSKNDCSNQASRRSGTTGAGSCRTALNLHADARGTRAPVQRADELFAWRAAPRVACCYSANTRVGDRAT